MAKSAALAWCNLRNTMREISEHMDKSLEDNCHVISNDLYNKEVIWILDKLYASNVLEAVNEN